MCGHMGRRSQAVVSSEDGGIPQVTELAWRRRQVPMSARRDSDSDTWWKEKISEQAE